MRSACAYCQKPAAEAPPLRWWLAPDRLACSHACAAVLNEMRRAAGLPPIRWSYVDQRAEPRDTNVAELSILLTLAHLRASASGHGASTPATAFNQPTSAGAELRFLTGAAIVILSRRDSLKRS
jgi:hypothetical protein